MSRSSPFYYCEQECKKKYKIGKILFGSIKALQPKASELQTISLRMKSFLRLSGSKIEKMPNIAGCSAHVY